VNTILVFIAIPFVLLLMVGLWVFLMDLRDSYNQRRKEQWIRNREHFSSQHPPMAVYKKDVGYVRPRNEP
jgi:hypothetical protein